MIEIVVPRLGWSMEEGTFAGWLKQPGDAVTSGDMLFQLEGDKATQDVESFDEGLLCVPDDAPQTGDEVKVGQVLGYLLAKDEVVPTSIAANVGSSSVPTSGHEVEPASSDRPVGDASSTAGPAVRRLARQLGVDLTHVQGSGPRGRIVAEDVRSSAGNAVARSTRDRIIASPRARRRAKQEGVSLATLTGTGRGGRIRERDVVAAANGSTSPQSRLRAVIAARMMAGVHDAAPVTLQRKVRADQLLAYRDELKRNPLDGVSPTINELLLRLTCTALITHLRLNATWQNNALRSFDNVHLAFGVDTPAGLLAPVVRDANTLSLDALSRTARDLVQRARAASINDAELTGGTFTVTNLGSLGIDSFTPILNLPQVAILGIGRAVQEPVAEEDQVVPGWTMQLSLTFDHRALDGADGARFLQTLSELMEELVVVCLAN